MQHIVYLCLIIAFAMAMFQKSEPVASSLQIMMHLGMIRANAMFNCKGFFVVPLLRMTEADATAMSGLE